MLPDRVSGRVTGNEVSPDAGDRAKKTAPSSGATRRHASRGVRWRPWADRSPRALELRDDLGRLAQVLLGLASAGLAIYVLAQPLLSLAGLVTLLAVAVGGVSAQTLLAGGRLLWPTGGGPDAPRSWWQRLFVPWGVIAIGLLAVALSTVAGLDSNLAVQAVVFVLALALVSQGLGRIFQSNGVTLPRWVRGSALGTGVFSIALVVASIAFYGFAIAAFAILVGVLLLVGGIESVVAGLRPTDPRQFVLLKLILFAAFYGLILINWIDLFGKTVPAYGVWLLLTYMAPFGVLLVFEGWTSWPLATSLGLLVSLFNDVGYYFIGNLLFGFHEALGPWIAGQLGFQGTAVVTYFEGGSFSITVESWMMGLSIYLRAIVVGAILYYWWRHPGEIVARMSPPSPSTPVRREDIA
jgi:uncharacterized membrane protein HdeD (DUF308 family)